MKFKSPEVCTIEPSNRAGVKFLVTNATAAFNTYSGLGDSILLEFCGDMSA